MAPNNLTGPHRLSFDDVHAVTRSGAPGVFALGFCGQGGVFFVNYVGRSDSDVRQRLLDFIGSDNAFKFNQVGSAKEAFMHECELYHSLRPRGNRLHPSRPRLSGWTCPKCRDLEGV
jgi:hypothetical protein